MRLNSVNREKFADRGMSHDFSERAWDTFFEKCDDYTEYLMLVEQDRVTGYCNTPMCLKRGLDILTSNADPNVDMSIT